MSHYLRLATLAGLLVSCTSAFSQIACKSSGQIGPPDNGESWKRNCPCAERLKESQVSRQVEHIEMEPDVMGNHVNVSGIAVVEVVVDNDGRVQCAQALSGHPLAISHLIQSSRKWKFKPYLKDGSAQRFCGRLRLKFSFVENKPSVEVVDDSR